MSYLSALFAFLFVMASPAMADDLTTLLDKMVAAYGGGATPPALLERGTTVSFRRGQGSVERLWAQGDAAGERFRIVIAYPGGTEKRAMIGPEAWQQDRPASAAFRDAVVLQAHRMALPWRLREARAALIDRGLQPASDGSLRRVVDWPVEPGMTISAEIDPANGRILRSVGRLEVMGSLMEFATTYADFVVGARPGYAATEQHYAMGQHIGETRLTEVSVPPGVDDAVFRPAR